MLDANILFCIAKACDIIKIFHRKTYYETNT